MAKLGSVATVVVAAGTAVCGLMLLGGVGPTPAGAAVPEGERVPSVEALQDVPAPPTSDAASPTSDVATSTTSTTTTTTTTTVPAPPSPVPLAVSPDVVTVGAGGVARITGQCATVAGVPAGPVEIWEIGETINEIATGVTAASWTYDWTAPARPAPLVLQVWCGDPTGFTEGYPASLQVAVEFVAQEQPAPTTTTTLAHAIPETD